MTPQRPPYAPPLTPTSPPQVVRSAATSGAGSTTSGVVSGSLGSREVNYILRVLGPAACRSPTVFTEVATGCIRIALPAPRGSGTGGGPGGGELGGWGGGWGVDVGLKWGVSRLWGKGPHCPLSPPQPQ